MLTLNDLVSVRTTAQSGQLFKADDEKPKRAELELTVSHNDGDDSCSVSVSVKIDQDDSPLIQAEAVMFFEFKSEKVEGFESQEFLMLVWPFLRSRLESALASVGHSNAPLPLSLDPNRLHHGGSSDDT